MKTEDIDKRIGMPDVDAEWARFEQEVIGKESKTNKRSIYSWMGGLGTYLGEHVSATLFYMGLGSHRIEYTAKSFKPEGDDFNATKRSLGVLGLRVGFHF